MVIILSTSLSESATREYTCEPYDCGCDVEGNCNPDCPGYNPCADCWTGE